MSMRTKNQQRKTWDIKDYFPIVDSVSIMADISNIHKNKHDSHPSHFNIHDYLTSNKPESHDTLPIDNIHIELEASRKAVEFGLKLAEEQKKPFMVDKNSRIYKAFDKAVNPLWSNELTEDPLKRSMRSEIGGHTYKPTFNKPSFGSLPKSGLNSYQIKHELGGYDMGRTNIQNQHPLNIPVPSNMSVADAYKVANGNMTMKEAYAMAEKGGTGWQGGCVQEPFDPRRNRLRDGGKVWRPVEY